MRACLAGLVLLVCVQPLFAQGRLEQARQEMEGSPKPKEEPSSKAKSQPSSHDQDDDNPFGELFAPLGVAVLKGIVAPFWLPAVLLHDERQHEGYFPGHPYAVEEIRFINPYSEPKQPADLAAFDPVRYKPWSVRVAVEDGNDFNGLNRAGLRAAADTGFRLGLTTNWDFFRERLRCGCIDESVVGDLNLTYRFAQSDWMQMHAGLGGRIWTDRWATYGGFNFTYGADFFPIQPLVVSTQVDLGNLSNAFVTRARATVGLQIDRWELYGGYDFLRIGSVNFQGPMIGARLWFYRGLAMPTGARTLGLLLFAALPTWLGCFAAPKPAAPAFSYAQPAGERYYCLVFSAQSTPKLPRYTHTWVTVVCAAEREPGCPPALDAQTISWMPAAIDIRPFDPFVEPGVNLDLHTTLREVLARGERVSLWGPFEMRWGTYQNVLRRKRFIESGHIGYQAFDVVGEAASGDGVNCIHAITGADPAFGPGRALEIGDDAGSAMAASLACNKALVCPERTHDWLITALGLERYPIARRTARVPAN